MTTKRKYKFDETYTRDFPEITRCEINDERVYCSTCKSEITIVSLGKTAIKNHFNTVKHKRAEFNTRQQQQQQQTLAAVIAAADAQPFAQQKLMETPPQQIPTRSAEQTSSGTIFNQSNRGIGISSSTNAAGNMAMISNGPSVDQTSIQAQIPPPAVTQQQPSLVQSLPSPVYQPTVYVPYFDMSTYQQVNLGMMPSKSTDGMDMPFNDLHSLRFYFNFGVAQHARLVLLNQHFNNSSNNNAFGASINNNKNNGTTILTQQKFGVLPVPQAAPTSVLPQNLMTAQSIYSSAAGTTLSAGLTTTIQQHSFPNLQQPLTNFAGGGTVGGSVASTMALTQPETIMNAHQQQHEQTVAASACFQQQQHVVMPNEYGQPNGFLFPPQTPTKRTLYNLQQQQQQYLIGNSDDQLQLQQQQQKTPRNFAIKNLLNNNNNTYDGNLQKQQQQQNEHLSLNKNTSSSFAIQIPNSSLIQLELQQQQQQTQNLTMTNSNGAGSGDNNNGIMKPAVDTLSFYQPHQMMPNFQLAFQQPTKPMSLATQQSQMLFGGYTTTTNNNKSSLFDSGASGESSVNKERQLLQQSAAQQQIAVAVAATPSASVADLIGQQKRPESVTVISPVVSLTPQKETILASSATFNEQMSKDASEHQTNNHGELNELKKDKVQHSLRNTDSTDGLISVDGVVRILNDAIRQLTENRTS